MFSLCYCCPQIFVLQRIKNATACISRAKCFSCVQATSTLVGSAGTRDDASLSQTPSSSLFIRPPLQVFASVIFETVVFSLSLSLSPWHSPTCTQPWAPLWNAVYCEAYGGRASRDRARASTHTHIYTCTHAHALTHSQQHTRTRTLGQIQLLRSITTILQTSKSRTGGVGKPSFREKDGGKEIHCFPRMLC